MHTLRSRIPGPTVTAVHTIESVNPANLSDTVAAVELVGPDAFIAAAARRRKAKQKAREQGKTCRADYLFLLGWDILLTNLHQTDWTLA